MTKKGVTDSQSMPVHALDTKAGCPLAHRLAANAGENAQIQNRQNDGNDNTDSLRSAAGDARPTAHESSNERTERNRQSDQDVIDQPRAATKCERRLVPPPHM